MGNDFEEECLKAHNEYRRKHGAQPLVLDREICNVAQRWANYIASRNVMQHSSGTGYGENIYGSYGQKVNGRVPVESWYSEVKHYTYGCGFSMQTGHFTQVVWKGSQKLGVAKATGSSGWTYVVANYYPPGNFANKFKENVLPPGNYFTEAPKKEVQQPSEKETQVVQKSESSVSKGPSSKEISDEIKKQIAEFTVMTKGRDGEGEEGDLPDDELTRHIVDRMAERFNQYEWVCFLDNASDTADEVVNSFSYLIDGNEGSKALVSVVQLKSKSSDGADELSDGLANIGVSDKAEAVKAPVKEPTPAPKPEHEFDKFSRECLEAHNEYRKRHGCPPLKLAKWLCDVAQNWAQRCASMDAMQHSHDHANDNENIFCSSAPRSSIKGREPVDCFYSEIKYYSFGRMEFSMQTGHFTAMIWKSCKELGVGVATSRSGRTYVVNSYSPKVNMMGAFAANVPPPQY